MSGSVKFAFALLAGAVLMGMSEHAQALELGACIAKTDLNAALQKEGQSKVIGAIQWTKLGKGPNAPEVPMKVTFTSNAKKMGWILKEDGCLPSVTNGSTQPIGVRVYMPAKEVTVYENTAADVPNSAKSKLNPALAIAQCKTIKPIGSPNPSEDERITFDRSARLIDALHNHQNVSVMPCHDLDAYLNGLKKTDMGVMLQEKTVMPDGSDGMLLTVEGQNDNSLGQVLLTSDAGATVEAEIFSMVGYIEGYKQFITH